MNNLYYYTIPIFLIIFSLGSCKKEKENPASVTFDIGFEELKNYQGIYKNDGEEGAYFFKRSFSPQVKFYDLLGNLKDSLSIQFVEDRIGRIGRFSVISRDTMIAVSYQKDQMAGFKKDGTFLFQINLDSLSGLTEENKYGFYGSLTPSPIHIGNNIIFILIWDGKYKNKYQSNSISDYYKYILKNRMHSPILCKVESIYSRKPRIKYGLRNYYYNRSAGLKSYGLSEKNYAILNNKLFVILANDRNIYEIDVNTLNVIDTIPIIPQIYEIPSGIKLVNKPGISEDKLAQQEVKDKCHITNMLYSNTKRQYYVFLKTGKDKSVVDELGYPFNVFVYDEHFSKKKEYPFETDEYNPKSAMMTSKGIMIEKINKKQTYGKKSFEFMDL